MTAEQRRRKWRRLIERLFASGMSHREFCKAEGISCSSLRYHLCKERETVRRAPGDQQSLTPFIELGAAAAAPERSYALELVLASGTTIRADCSIPVETIITLARALAV